jgi:hypothetical protein
MKKGKLSVLLTSVLILGLFGFMSCTDDDGGTTSKTVDEIVAGLYTEYSLIDLAGGGGDKILTESVTYLNSWQTPAEKATVGDDINAPAWSITGNADGGWDVSIPVNTGSNRQINLVMDESFMNYYLVSFNLPAKSDSTPTKIWVYGKTSGTDAGIHWESAASSEKKLSGKQYYTNIDGAKLQKRTEYSNLGIRLDFGANAEGLYTFTIDKIGGVEYVDESWVKPADKAPVLEIKSYFARLDDAPWVDSWGAQTLTTAPELDFNEDFPFTAAADVAYSATLDANANYQGIQFEIQFPVQDIGKTYKFTLKAVTGITEAELSNIGINWSAVEKTETTIVEKSSGVYELTSTIAGNANAKFYFRGEGVPTATAYGFTLNLPADYVTE